ncbi:MCE family protein [Mycolicibacterium holsaticum]|uniref:MCE family protein n=1 Tax=Mycolicibacterium holsaticum TaxID=152142 RepID=UPI001C7CB5F8|nr:MCE family protein [Mycolicibacterium holsaticum]MDA4105760.1 MCE-family protein MCE3A [Mycolicibacterium holsaticum DSM 44478 = JCM 12374]QZA13874.1 MCE family protein [Mycolicibacterium holsaticum DSM 44478 = JCM 12374]UNC08666.1 MCE family protein [Mycolicibacterium holsaticum DSM 44478 = JCM 12374]
MATGSGQRRINPLWWTALLVVFCVLFVLLSSALFAEKFRSFVPVTLTSQRSGLVMESGAKVKMRGVQVGRVAGIEAGRRPVRMKLELYPDQVKFIPANVTAEIRATTVFGAKYVDLIYPEHPSAERLSAGAELISRNVSTEVNTVFQNLLNVLRNVDPPKLNAVLSAMADGVEGQGERIGRATTDANHVLMAVNPRMDTVARDWRALRGFADTYDAAAEDILTVLDAVSATSTTISTRAAELNGLLLAVAGFGRVGVEAVAPGHDNMIRAINVAEPTTGLLMKYNPEFTCMLVGAKWWLDNGGYAAFGGNGKSLIIDTSILLGDNPYRYPDHLPIVAAKGGPGGRPGCGSLPDASKNFPVRQLVTNTGWGTGQDIRSNPGIGHPWWVNYFPVTRAVPQPPGMDPQRPPPASGPIPPPEAPLAAGSRGSTP